MRVLVVSPHFPPTNAPDMQRARLLLPYFQKCGVSVEVLAVESAQVSAPCDPWLEGGLPAEIPIHRGKALGLAWGRFPGFGGLALRAIRSLAKLGDRILGSKKFDLVFFSTTAFSLHTLGIRWEKKFGVPFVMDYQDPWLTDYYKNNGITPPGGWLKYNLATALGRWQEPRVLKACRGFISVSPAYAPELQTRYPWLNLPNEVHGFPGDSLDFQRVLKENVHQSIFDANDGLQHWVYVGVFPPSMNFALRAIFHALRSLKERNPEEFSRLRLHFIGTSYAAAGRGKSSVSELAQAYGLEAVVAEVTDRIPYSQALRCLLDADALLIPGSDDPGYTASKIYPYLLTKKPMLAVFHQESSVVPLLQAVGGANLVSFDQSTQVETLGKTILKQAFPEGVRLTSPALDEAKFAPHTAAHQAQAMVQFWKKCLANG